MTHEDKLLVLALLIGSLLFAFVVVPLVDRVLRAIQFRLPRNLETDRAEHRGRGIGSDR